ncbi:hypothetical protein U1Q18_027093 [Sarracenia purpurea var. burkii]
MVQLMNSRKAPPELGSQHRKIMPVKLEVEDSSDDRHGQVNKRLKLSSPLPQQYNLGPGNFQIQPSQYNPLDEPSPLGLRLKKSPSLLDLIQMKLSQGNFSRVETQAKKEHEATTACGTSDKLKASNFPASFLRIGTWEYKSRHEGDLVAKCYFAKHKLVWEVLDGGLKNKLEIQWSDIIALKANYPDDKPGTLDVVLSRRPLFFRETNPQPRKHTLWQTTSDFTGGQASINRRHFLQCPQGLLGKHFEKLIQCDPRLNFLSQQGEIVVGSPYFETNSSVFDNSNESDHRFDLNGEERKAFFDLQNAASPSGSQSSPLKYEQEDLVGRPREQFSRETPSPGAVMDRDTIKEIWRSKIEQNQTNVPELHSSMSMSDLVSHIEHRISGQRTSNNLILSAKEQRQSLEILEDISRFLLNDYQHTSSASDEQCVMSRVNSLCCLLQKDPLTVQNLQVKGSNSSESFDAIMDRKIGEPNSVSPSASESKVGEDFTEPNGQLNDVSGCKHGPAMSRKDSVGELLLNLPKIASLPRFLFNISEDLGNQAR